VVQLLDGALYALSGNDTGKSSAFLGFELLPRPKANPTQRLYHLDKLGKAIKTIFSMPVPGLDGTKARDQRRA
jgi:hypothetical protein